jgi:hypothetical protein
MDNLIKGSSGNALKSALQLELDVVPDLCLLPGLGLGLSFELQPGSVFAAGMPFGLLGRDA